MKLRIYRTNRSKQPIEHPSVMFWVYDENTVVPHRPQTVALMETMDPEMRAEFVKDHERMGRIVFGPCFEKKIVAEITAYKDGNLKFEFAESVMFSEVELKKIISKVKAARRRVKWKEAA